MNTHPCAWRTRLALLTLATAALLLGGCASDKGPGNAVFDFGPALSEAPTARAPLPALVLTDATGSPTLDTERMSYRLNYADPLQARAYANSRWGATPLQMITQRLKARTAQSGAKVLNVTDAAAGLPILRIDVDDFTHVFDNPATSHGQLNLRASLFQGHKLIDQKTFQRKVPASSADAAGGARALTSATDTVAADILAWLATLQLSK